MEPVGKYNGPMVGRNIINTEAHARHGPCSPSAFPWRSPPQQTAPVQGAAIVAVKTPAARDANTHMAAVTDARRLDVATLVATLTCDNTLRIGKHASYYPNRLAGKWPYCV